MTWTLSALRRMCCLLAAGPLVAATSAQAVEIALPCAPTAQGMTRLLSQGAITKKYPADDWEDELWVYRAGDFTLAGSPLRSVQTSFQESALDEVEIHGPAALFAGGSAALKAAMPRGGELECDSTSCEWWNGLETTPAGRLSGVELDLTDDQFKLVCNYRTN